MRQLAALLWGLNLLAAEDDPTGVLIRLRDQVLQHGERIPDHRCVETIQRDRYQPHERSSKSCDVLLARRKQAGAANLPRIAITDWLRLDVLLADGRELYSWGGDQKFDEDNIDKLIREGAMGTGPFAAMLLSVFEPRNPRLYYEGETSLDGRRRLLQYSFTVTQARSQYRVKAGNEWLTTGYDGTLLVDPRTAELVRLTVRTDELPPATSLCETQTKLDYGKVQFGASDYLLPQMARQRFIGRDGAESENIVTFSACREYKGESTVTYGEKSPPADGKQGRVAYEPWDFPAGLAFSAQITTAVHLERAADGDRIEGRLASAIRDEQQRKTFAPAGATLEGRLMRVEIRYSHPPEYTVAIRWETLGIEGVKRPLAAIPKRQTEGLNATRLGGVLRRKVEIELPLPGEDRYVVYHFKGEHAVIESGLPSERLTARL